MGFCLRNALPAPMQSHHQGGALTRAISTDEDTQPYRSCSSAALRRRLGGIMPKRGAPVEALQRVPLFADLSQREVRQIARLFKQRRFDAGETVVKEGSGGAAFFVIESGEATVFIRGKKHTTLKAGDYFGEIALIDERSRMAT